MHEKARKWDVENGVDTSFGTGKGYPKDRPLPKDRPCDWCGETVEEGFIHQHCMEAERDLYMDICY